MNTDFFKGEALSSPVNDKAFSENGHSRHHCSILKPIHTDRPKAYDYHCFSLRRINEPQFRHLKYLIFWPIYLLSFAALERLWIQPYYYPVHCAVDDIIPFCEWFLIPYVLWYAELLLIQVYTLMYDIEEFKNFIRFLSISFLMTLIIYMVFPSCQELRVNSFDRDNLLTRMTSLLYNVDTNTNVCPSLHVVGALGVMFSAFRAKGLNSRSFRVFMVIFTTAVSMSTVFMKQHSFVDVITAVPLSFAVYFVVYHMIPLLKHKSG